MVTTNKERTRAELEGFEFAEEEEKPVTHWKDATPVRVNAIPLSEALFSGEVEHRSLGTKKRPEGLVTVIDSEFAKYRIGYLFSPIENKVQELAEAGELQGFVLDAIDYYHHFLEERGARQREARREEILEKAEKQYNRIKMFLIAANPEMKKWSKEKMVNWIAENQEL